MVIIRKLLLLIFAFSGINSQLPDDLSETKSNLPQISRAYRYNHPPLFEGYEVTDPNEFEVRKVREVTDSTDVSLTERPVQAKKRNRGNILKNIKQESYSSENIPVTVTYDKELTSEPSDRNAKGAIIKVKKRKQPKQLQSQSEDTKPEINTEDKEIVTEKINENLNTPSPPRPIRRKQPIRLQTSTDVFIPDVIPEEKKSVPEILTEVTDETPTTLSTPRTRKRKHPPRLQPSIERTAPEVKSEEKKILPEVATDVTSDSPITLSTPRTIKRKEPKRLQSTNEETIPKVIPDDKKLLPEVAEVTSVNPTTLTIPRPIRRKQSIQPRSSTDQPIPSVSPQEKKIVPEVITEVINVNPTPTTARTIRRKNPTRTQPSTEGTISILNPDENKPESFTEEKKEGQTTPTAPRTSVPKVFTRRPSEFNPVLKQRRQRDPVVRIIDEKNYVFAHKGDFHFSYEGADGTKVSSQGQLKTFDEDKTGEAVVGSVFYKDNDGNDVSLSYTADENGYRPHGAHLPTPPPIPPAIARALKYLATATTPEPVTKPSKYEQR